MTDELLNQGNAIKNRLYDVKKLLEQLDLTDPSGVDDTTRISPIVIQAGMAQTVQFDALAGDEDSADLTRVQILDARIHKMIVEIIKDYKIKLEEAFRDLA
jgi:hypothetical protein|nr:MAG TPA: hypothetical protein [Caudoviricetes sp.]